MLCVTRRRSIMMKKNSRKSAKPENPRGGATVFVEKAADAQPDDPVERASKANDAIEGAYPRRAASSSIETEVHVGALRVGQKQALREGRAEKVLERCTHVRVSGSLQKLTQASKNAILDAVAEMASRPCCACSPWPSGKISRATKT